MSEEKEVGWCEISGGRWVYGEAEPIFSVKSSAFSGGVGSCFVNMNNESPPINLQAERNKFSENIDTVVLGIKCITFRKRVEYMKFQWIPPMVTVIFWSWMVCLGLSRDCSST
jgi:hypothetical protein